jgi:hypothetical protein
MKILISLCMFLAATIMAAEPELNWKQTDSSLALMRGEQVVWKFNYKKEEGKPYFHPVTVGGSNTLTDLRPSDHYWHRALWFSWKMIDGLNYWEEDPKTGKSQGQTEVLDVKATSRPDRSARFEVTISYHPPGKAPVMTEACRIDVSAPAVGGAYAMDWVSRFTAAEADVLLDRTPIVGEPNGVGWGGYAGLSLRLAPALKQWQFADRDGVIKQTSKQAKWMSFSGPLAEGKSGSIIVLEHPSSFRHPTTWYLINNMPYFSPAVLYRGSYTLPARQSITLKYRLLFQPEAVNTEKVEQAWQSFAKELVELK